MQVRDRGRWPPGPEHRPGGQRHGLAIVRGMVDRLSLERSAEGTLATIRHRLGRPADMLVGAPSPQAPLHPRDEESAFRLRSEDARVDVGGHVDADHVETMQRALGALVALDRVVLDLEAVTHLPSVAVQALYDEQQGASDRGQELVLFAPAGSPAQHVLETVRLPYALTDPDVGARA